MRPDPTLLTALTAEASRRLHRELDRRRAAGGDPAAECRRRARDYDTWGLMRGYPARVSALAASVAAAAGQPAPDAGSLHDWSLALVDILAELYREAAGRTGGDQLSGQ